MRRLLAFCGVCSFVLLAACGGKKAAKDPSDEDKPPAGNDDTPKWEGGGTSTGPSTDANRPAKPAGGNAPIEQPKQRTDQYDKEGTEVALKRAARQVKDNCGQAKDENGKAIGPWGKVTIQVQLGANGHTKGTTVPPPYQGKPVGTCIERSFTNLSFPPWQGSDTSISWDVELVEPAKK